MTTNHHDHMPTWLDGPDGTLGPDLPRRRRSQAEPDGSWLGDLVDPSAERRRPRRWLLPLLATVPWAVVAVVMLRPDPAQPAVAAEPATVSEMPAATPPDAQVSAPAPSPTDAAVVPAPATDGGVRLFASGARTTPGTGDAAALAVAAARAWLTGVGPTLEIAGIAPVDEAQYLEHVAVEAVDFPAPGAAVVTLQAVVLDSDGEAYTDARLRRLAVPIRLDADGARLAGQPWRLPDPSLDLDPIDAAEPVDDPDLLSQAGAAVTAAGYTDVAVDALSQGQLWPWVATVTAVAPGETQPRAHEVWLRLHLGELVVAGTNPERAGSDEIEVSP